MQSIYLRRHAREGGHPVSQSVGDSISDALGYWVPAFAGTTAEGWRGSMKIPRRRQDAHVAGMVGAGHFARVVAVVHLLAVDRLDQRRRGRQGCERLQ